MGRARVAVLLGFALVCAGVAASIVSGYARDIRAQVGPSVPVAVARVDVPRGKLVTASNAGRLFAIEKVPRRYVAPGLLGDPDQAVGYRTAAPIVARSYIGEAALIAPGADGADAAATGTASLARVVQVQVSGAGGLGDALRPGTVVDVLVTSDRGSATPRTYLALQRVDLLDVRPVGADAGTASGDGRAGADAVAVLAVTLRQALFLTAAANFAREVRLVPRRPGDRRVLPPAVVSADQLNP